MSVGTLGYLGGVSLVLALEVAFLGYAKSSIYRLLHPTRSTSTDILWFSLKVLGLNGIILSIISARHERRSPRGSPSASSASTCSCASRTRSRASRSTWCSSTSSRIAQDHRGRHQIGWWWELHKAHHSAEEFNAITTTRGHPFDGVAMAISTAIPVALLGGSMLESIPVLTLFAAHAGLARSMLQWRWGWFGRYVVLPPTGHRIHHSAVPEHLDKNFGAIFPVWDWIFGTYYRGDVLNAEVGVDDNYQEPERPPLRPDGVNAPGTPGARGQRVVLRSPYQDRAKSRATLRRLSAPG